MGKLSSSAKEKIVQKALNRGEKPLALIAVENNVGYSTLQKWIKCFKEGKALACLDNERRDRSTADSISEAEKVQHILCTISLDNISLGKYCRENGIYSHQISQWREAFMKDSDKKQSVKEHYQLKKLKAENKRLQRELKRKEKALAESSALLELKKKADLIWGEKEED